MDGCMLEYYFFKDVLQLVDEEKKKDFIINDSNIFNLATFIDIGEYFKFNNRILDKIELNKKWNNENFNLFFTECMIEVNLHYSSEKLMLLYALFSSHILKTKLLPYLKSKENEENNMEEILKMLDFIYAKKKDSWDLTKIKLTKKFPDGFKYEKYMYDVVHYPTIKIYKQFLSENYFIKCYKKKKRFYSFYTSGLRGLKIPFLKLLNFKLKKKKRSLKSYFYSNKVDTTLLNKAKDSYKVENIEYKYTLDEQITNAINETVNVINYIYDYVMNNKDKQVRKYFNIPHDKKI